MSSQVVRTEVNAAVTALAAPWPTFDLSDYQTLREVLQNITAEAVLIQYVVADEEMQTIGGEGNQGWEERGTAVIHLITPTGYASAQAISKGDSIKNGLRGRRLSSSLVIESMSPFVDFGSGSAGVDGAVHGYASSLYYVRRDCG